MSALIVRIDSPGGTVVGGETLFRELREIARQQAGGCRNGRARGLGRLHDGAAAEQIFAREGTITGSIGVILQTTDVTGLLEKLGVTTEAIKSAPLKAVPSPLEPLTDEGRRATGGWSTTCTPCSSTWWRSAGASTGQGRRTRRRARLYRPPGQGAGPDRRASAARMMPGPGWPRPRASRAACPVRELKIRREDEEWQEWMGWASPG